MIIGVPKETKTQEYRVGMVPAGVKTLTSRGHRVLVEHNAGLGSGLADDAYVAMGATIVDSAAEVWNRAEMVVKVKEPLPAEYGFMRPGQLLYTYFHLAAAPQLAAELLARKVTAVAYETIQLPDGSLPLLRPMSEVAGRMAIQVGAACLEKEHGGRGVLLGGVPGVRHGRIAILGGGVVGTNAAKIAVGMGAQVQLLDIDLNRLAYLDDIFGARIETLYSDPGNIEAAVTQADLVIGAVLVAGARAPTLVSRELVARMLPGAVIVDVAVDQGGCIATCKPTTHENPIYTESGVIHYCVANMPGAVARTSTFALTNATIPYAIRLADLGPEKAALADRALRLGLNTYKGHCVHEAVAHSLDLPYRDPADLIG